MSLLESIEALLAALKERQAAKARWLAIIDHGEDGDPMAARQRHFQCDERVEQLAPQLVHELQLARSGGLLEIQLLKLDSDKLEALRGFLADRNLDELLKDGAPEVYTELVELWYQSSKALDAARRINYLRQECLNLRELKQLLAAEPQSNQEAIERAVATLDVFFEQSEEGSETERLADATHVNMRFWLSRYDGLTEHLQEATEDLVASGTLSYELEELEVATRKALVGAIDGGLIRQLQPEAKPETSTKEVTTITRPNN